MNNFYCYNPTKILFGRNMIERIPNELAGVERILLLYGGGSIKRNGVLDKIREVLQRFELFEFGGVEQNPEYETALKALAYARNKKIDLILAVGGGSVADAAKFLSLAFHHEGEDPWRLVTQEAPPPRQMLPVGCIQTLPASGSEMNNAFVLSRRELKRKLSFNHIQLFPRFSVLDPETTFSLSPRQTALGIVDIFVHVLEQYVTSPVFAPLQDRQAEAILCTVAELAEPLLREPENYDLRASVMWCACQAPNGLISRGVPADWSTHMIGHELTALYDIPHGQTLALIWGGVMRHQLAFKQKKLAQYGRRVWQIVGAEEEVARQAIDATEAFFARLGVATRISALGLDAGNVADEVVRQFSGETFQNLGEGRNIDLDAIRAIICRQA